MSWTDSVGTIILDAISFLSTVDRELQFKLSTDKKDTGFLMAASHGGHVYRNPVQSVLVSNSRPVDCQHTFLLSSPSQRLCVTLGEERQELACGRKDKEMSRMQVPGFLQESNLSQSLREKKRVKKSHPMVGQTRTDLLRADHSGLHFFNFSLSLPPQSETVGMGER